MSKHNKKNTLSFVILALMATSPALTSAGGLLGAFRVLAHLNIGLGFNLGELKVQKTNLSVTDQVLKEVQKGKNSDQKYFSTFADSLEAYKNSFPNTKYYKNLETIKDAFAPLVDLFYDENGKLRRPDRVAAEKAVLKISKEAPDTSTGNPAYSYQYKANILSADKELRDNFKKYQDRVDGITEPSPLVEWILTRNHVRGAQPPYLFGMTDNNSIDSIRWASDVISAYEKQNDSGAWSFDDVMNKSPSFASASSYSCNVPDFWRRLEFAGEVSALLQTLDWLAIGIHGGLTGSLHQSQLNSISRVRNSVNFSVKFGAALQLTRWFQCAFMATAEHNSFKRDALDLSSTNPSDNYKKEIENYNSAINRLNGYNTEEYFISKLSKANTEAFKAAVKKYDDDFKKEFLDSFEVSGWSWGIKVQPAFLLWFNEMIALKLGAEFTFPLSEIKDDKVNLKFTPAPRAALMVGIVLSII